MENSLYIVWNDNYATGILIIDEQHRGIVSAINSLHFFVKNGQGDTALLPTLRYLEQYSDIHFRTEEGLMSEADYPALEEHIQMHNALSKKTKSISTDLSKINDMGEVLKFLREWWLTHINKEDRKYAPYVLEIAVTS